MECSLVWVAFFLYHWGYGTADSRLHVPQSRSLARQGVIDVPQIYVRLTDDKPEGAISSPGFPNQNYPPNTQVEYNVQIALSNIVEQLGSRILINFDVFILEKSEFCHKDGLEVIDTDGQVRAFCGPQTGRTLLSDNTAVKFRFFSDNRTEERGFYVTLKVYRSTCSKYFTGVNSGTFSTPNYPVKYDKDDVCVWMIQAPPGQYIRLKFDQNFEILGEMPSCGDDYLTVSRTGDFLTDISWFCGNKAPGTIDSKGNTMLLIFRSDCCFEGKGFQASFAVVGPDLTSTTPPPILDQKCSCGKENPATTMRIIGGEDVYPHNRFPWMVGLLDLNGDTDVYCGAAVISHRYLLTAAHCVEGKSPADIVAIVGTSNIPSPTNTQRAISRIIMNPQFDRRKFYNDIALLELTSPLDFNADIAPVCLPESDLTTMTPGFIVAGWGRTKEAGEQSEKLKFGAISMVPQPQCVQKYGTLITQNQLCAAGKNVDACQGDSGGPLIGQVDGQWYQLGVVSWGIGCARENQSGVYTRVSAYKDWINSIIGNDAICPKENDTGPLQPNLQDCGIPNTVSVQGRIVGGTPTNINEFPWLALILSNSAFVGTGALLSSRYVLTASGLITTWMRQNPQYLDIRLGQYYRQRGESYTSYNRVSRTISSDTSGQDLILLLLDRSVDTTFFRPICLPRSFDSAPPGTPVVTCGWGRTSSTGPYSDVLRKVTLNIVSRSTCSNAYPGYINQYTLCTLTAGKDACYGDGGAPLMHMQGGRYYLWGILSFGNPNGCAIQGKPSVYADVAMSLNWIGRVTGLAVAR